MAFLVNDNGICVSLNLLKANLAVSTSLSIISASAVTFERDAAPGKWSSACENCQAG